MYKPGEHYVICDRCGLKKRRSECKKTWDNLIVCALTCFEERHPQDVITSRKESAGVKDTRPEATDVFLTRGQITVDDL